MNKSTKADTKRVKHWERVSSLRRTAPVENQAGTGTGFVQAAKAMSDSEVALVAFTKKVTDQNEGLRNWDNEGGTISAPSPNP